MAPKGMISSSSSKEKKRRRKKPAMNRRPKITAGSYRCLGASTDVKVLRGLQLKQVDLNMKVAFGSC